MYAPVSGDLGEVLDPLRGDPEFEAAMSRAKVRHEEAVAAFKSAGGERIVGVRV